MDNSVMDNAPVMQEPAAAATTQEERMLPQSQVNELIGNAKREAAEKAATRAVEDYKRQQAANSNYSAQPMQQPGFNDEHFERKTLEILEKQKTDWERQQQEKQQAEYAERIVNAYKEKIAAGRDKYADFETVTGNVNMSYYPNVVQLLAEHVDNAPDILYNLAQRRGKLDEIDRLCERNPQDALYELKRLSDSIKANESAGHIKSARTPLSQTRPSNSGTDSGVLSVSDFKRMYKV